MLEVLTLPILTDNYVYFIRDHEADITVVVDPGESAPVLQMMADYGWTLDFIWVTHWHGDHTDGIADLKQATDAQVIAPTLERDKIPPADFYVQGGKTFLLGHHQVMTIATPGHTMGHVSYYIPDGDCVFVGDALFALGCGRLFEGSAADGWDGMVALRDLPANTHVFFGHEYTENNLAFSQWVMGNGLHDTDVAMPIREHLNQRGEDILKARQMGHPTTPTTIGAESLTNLFMQCDDNDVAAMAGVHSGNPVEVFATLRSAKDNF